MAATDWTDWSNFFVASTGATSALVGLVFVTLSINLQRILALPGVPGRAVETLIVLAGALLCSLAALVPHPAPGSLATLLLIVAVPTWALPLVIQVRMLRRRRSPFDRLTLVRMLLHQAATLPAVIAALSVSNLHQSAVAWLALGAALSMLVAMVNAWVLLIEILR